MMVFNNTNRVPVFDVDTCRAEYISAKKGTILVDNNLLEDDKEVQYRSTVAHEAGHWILHNGVFAEDENQLSFFDSFDEQRKREPIIQCRSIHIGDSKGEVYRNLKTDEDWMEHQAKHFSAALLMPKSTMIEFCNDIERRCEIIMDYKGKENYAMSQMVAKYFNVSFTSAVIRIKQLHLNFQDEKSFRCG
jgi:Zn-dependent peptidase ImmA (M78 family)